ncbi:MAG TPA: CDP-alcohol phosphatidyltransferase family protein [Aestuariivirga sp.]|nr:CDP-alcohol phosphatidyltransferase family protein [Aestuariivirga sp.]
MHDPKVASPDPIDVYIVGTCDTCAFALPQAERLRRGLVDMAPFRFHAALDDAPEGRSALVVRADWVIEKRILQALTAADGRVLRQPSGSGHVYAAAFVTREKLNDAIQLLADQPAQPPAWLCSVKVGSAAEIGGHYERKLRKREAPVAAELTAASRDAVERALFRSAYKGATDFITKYLWPVPAFHVVRVLAKRGVSPNVITLVGLVCVVATFILFWRGHFWMGLASAYVMAFLDTVDGKLARVTVTSSPMGHLLDHGIDLISPPFWWAAWFAGVLGSDFATTPIFQTWGWPAFWSVMTLYWLVRGVEALFSAHFAIHIHIWRPIDFAFRQITTRRNVNIAILTAGMLISRPDLGFLALAAWASASFLFHFARLAQALIQEARGIEVRSWLSEHMGIESVA